MMAMSQQRQVLGRSMTLAVRSEKWSCKLLAVLAEVVAVVVINSRGLHTTTVVNLLLAWDLSLGERKPPKLLTGLKSHSMTLRL